MPACGRFNHVEGPTTLRIMIGSSTSSSDPEESRQTYPTRIGNVIGGAPVLVPCLFVLVAGLFSSWLL